MGLFSLFRPNKQATKPVEEGEIFYSESHVDSLTQEIKGKSLVMLNKKESDGWFSGRALTSNRDKTHKDDNETFYLNTVKVSMVVDKQVCNEKPYLKVSMFGNKIKVNEDHIDFTVLAKVDKEKAKSFNISKYLFGE
jgi:hypothetical protein